jgi:hypothetical protein
MSRMNQLSEHRTTWDSDGTSGGVTYIRTRIVEWRDGKVTLRSGGWETVTTKRKMNQASRQFALGFDVYQKDYDWFVTLPNGETVPFEDGMSFDANPARF